MFIVCLTGLLLLSAAAWKDDWITGFEKNAHFETAAELALARSCDPPKIITNCTWRLPRHVSIRASNASVQQIPRVIFQTWETYTASGPSQYKAAMSFVNDNPDYEYFLFDSKARLDFIRTFHPEQAPMYALILPGAMKADIWRLAVIQRYGGVYVDIDSLSRRPFSHFIWPNASVVTGVGAMGDFHQWVLMYVPNHPIINNALQIVWHRVRALHQARLGGSVAQTTGPVAFMAAAKNTLHVNKCPFNKNTVIDNSSGGYVHFLPDHYCSKSVGVMQIYNTDFLGGNIVFKDTNTDAEMKQKAGHYTTAQKHYHKLFKVDTIVASSEDGHRRERSGVKVATRVRSRPPNTNL